MAEIESRGLSLVLREAIERGTPLLGICIGMQLLFEESEEHGRHRGLGILPGRVRRFEGELKVPHMGWNTLSARRPHPVLEGIEDGAHVYFVHSYYCDAPDDVVIAASDYGREFPAIVGRDNVLGLQFHPEKSQSVGLRLAANFVRSVASRRARPRKMTHHTEGAA
jgi:glutamine amidotransferase